MIRYTFFLLLFFGLINAQDASFIYGDALQDTRHNVAHNPSSQEAFQKGLDINEYLRYTDSFWDMH